jgi:hypothetical protein
MGKKEQDQLEKYRAEIEVLRHEYELYFMGLEKRRPTSEHQRLTREIRRFSPGKDAIMRFRHQNLLQRVLSFERYWNRVLQAIEDGRYERDVFKADFRDRKRDDGTGTGTASRSGGGSGKAKEAGAEAAAFLAQLGDVPSVGMRGQSKRAPSLATGGDAKGPPAVGLRGKPVADRPAKKAAPPIDLRGKPVGRPKSVAPAAPPPPAIKMRGKSKKDDK